MRKYSHTSKFWKFFDKIEKGAICRICKRRIACFGNTSNAVKHLRRLHKTEYNQVSNSCKEKSKDSSDFEDNSGDGVTADDDAGDTAAEANSAVHTLQAYRDVNGTTFLYLQPAAEGETSAHFQPAVVSSESITANGEIVSVAVPKDASGLEGQIVDGEAKTPEESGARRLVHVPVKNNQGSVLASRSVVRQVNRPNPIKTSSAHSNSNSDSKDDCFDNFGKYIASMLRNLPSKTACKLQGEIVNWILKEQMKNNDS